MTELCILNKLFLNILFIKKSQKKIEHGLYLSTIYLLTPYLSPPYMSCKNQNNSLLLLFLFFIILNG